MKNISSFLFILFFFASFQLLSMQDSDSCPNQKRHKFIFNPFKKAWEHKKKIITITAAVIIVVCFKKNQEQWSCLRNNFFKAMDKELKDKGEIKIAATTYASFAKNSWFLFPHQREDVGILINQYPDYFPYWKTMGSNNLFEKIESRSNSWDNSLSEPPKPLSLFSLYKK